MEIAMLELERKLYDALRDRQLYDLCFHDVIHPVCDIPIRPGVCVSLHGAGRKALQAMVGRDWRVVCGGVMLAIVWVPRSLDGIAILPDLGRRKR
jgi:hypothetical protein